MKKSAAYGSWKSIVTPEYVAGKERVLTANMQAVGKEIYFLESRPDEGGRSVLMLREANGSVTEVLPKEFNVRTRYLEYGGLSFLVHGDSVYFVNFSDQQVYRYQKGNSPRKLTNESDHRFSDFVFDQKRARLIALREAHGKPESKNTICSIDLKTGAVQDLVSGADFYNCPRLNSAGDQILWTAWNHPNMPWNGTELSVAEVNEQGAIVHPKKIAGDQDHAICQGRWDQSGNIYFIAELGNWLNLYVYDGNDVKPLHPMDAEFAPPDWVPGQQQYAIDSEGVICAAYLTEGQWQIIQSGKDGAKLVSKPFAYVSTICATENGFLAIAGFPDRAPGIIAIDRAGKIEELYSSVQSSLPKEEVSVPEQIQYPTEDGGTGYAWYYAPQNSAYKGIAGSKPPLVVICHGGPTAMSMGTFTKGIQFWTNRGYAVVDVNYGGSTGYGRRYRERLRGNWGKVDISDCAAVVRKLAEEGKIDPKRVAIRGGSAGGYTTLGALTFTQGIFSVGASYYGVSDLEILAQETHKFESRYLDQLIGAYPKDLKIYKERSPLVHSDRLNCPIIFFQGTEDKVVPPNQSQLMHEALLKKNIPTEYHLYESEGHGFRKAENIQHSLMSEHRFYARFFEFQPDQQDLSNF